MGDSDESSRGQTNPARRAAARRRRAWTRRAARRRASPRAPPPVWGREGCLPSPMGEFICESDPSSPPRVGGRRRRRRSPKRSRRRRASGTLRRVRQRQHLLRVLRGGGLEARLAGRTPPSRPRLSASSSPSSRRPSKCTTACSGDSKSLCRTSIGEMSSSSAPSMKRPSAVGRRCAGRRAPPRSS